MCCCACFRLWHFWLFHFAGWQSSSPCVVLKGLESDESQVSGEGDQSVPIELTFWKLCVICVKKSRVKLDQTGSPKPGPFLIEEDVLNSKMQPVLSTGSPDLSYILSDMLKTAEEDSVDLTAAAGSVELPGGLNATFYGLREEIYPISSTRNTDF